MTAAPPTAPAPPAAHRRLGITVRIALLAWLVTLVTLAIFMAAIIQEQKRSYLANLASKARGVSASLQDVIASGVLSEDYSSVVEHCRQVLQGDPSIGFLIVTRQDGFALIHQSLAGETPLRSAPGARTPPDAPRVAWRTATLDPTWRPTLRQVHAAIADRPEFGGPFFGYAQPFDYSGIEWGWIHVGLSLADYDRAVRSLYVRASLLAAGCLLFSLIASAVYARRLVRPLLDLTSAVGRVARGDLAARAVVHRRDEIHALAQSFNTMAAALEQRDHELEQRVFERTRELREQIAAKERALAHLAEAQQRLIETSRLAGMAEVATEVLHNVGNVLNSINVSSTLAIERVRQSEVASLPRLTALLAEHQEHLAAYLTEDPQGRQLPACLILLAPVLTREQAALLAELRSLRDRIDHIKAIVAMQQGYARVSGVPEPVVAAQLVEAALALNFAAAGGGAHEIRLERDFAELPPLLLEKHKLLQIVLNLIRNAQQALEASTVAPKVLTLRLLRPVPERWALIVADNGQGIAPENLTRIFTHGFTTRPHGHGFGLHASALAARELGGTLTVASAGLGRGAAFTLELPLPPPPPAAPSTP